MQRPIPVYAAERRDGLTDIIQTNASISYLSPLTAVTPSEAVVQQAVAAKKIDDVTLIYFEDILATTGWNLNQDVFTHEELWAARHTIDHKPINMEHDYLQIMGHVVSSHAVDADFKAIADDAAIDELPEKFHVKNESVLYRTIGDADRDEFMANLERDILAGEYFVSMESFFNGFDYGVLGEDGSKAILPRNNATAFLTKHLRQYGGDGTYKDPVTGKAFSLGRVMKNVHFKGKGVVKRPGNPESVIFSSVNAFKAPFCDLGYVTKVGSAAEADIKSQEIIMPDAADLAAALEQIKTLQAENLTLANKGSETQIAALKADATTLAADKATLEAAIATLTTQNTAYTENIATLNAEVATLKADLDAKSLALAAIELTRETADRRAAILAKNADATLADSLVAKFAKMSRADFDDCVTVLAGSWTTAPAATKVEAEKAAITNASVEDVVTLAVGGEDDREATKAAVAEFYTRKNTK